MNCERGLGWECSQKNRTNAGIPPRSLWRYLYNRVMAVLKILVGENNPVLRKKTKKIPKVTKEILKLIKDMGAAMAKADGVGLAAPQIGESIRLCLALVDGAIEALINPDITWKSKETYLDQEGCLSLPGIWLDIPRSKEIIVKYTDMKGKPQEKKLTDFSARVVQHEVDHLEGVLIVDYVSAGKHTL